MFGSPDFHRIAHFGPKGHDYPFIDVMVFDKVAEADTAVLWSEWRRKKRILQERIAKSLHDGGKSCYLTNDCSLPENPLFAQLLKEGVGDYMAFPSTIEYGAHLRADEYKVEDIMLSSCGAKNARANSKTGTPAAFLTCSTRGI